MPRRRLLFLAGVVGLLRRDFAVLVLGLGSRSASPRPLPAAPDAALVVVHLGVVLVVHLGLVLVQVLFGIYLAPGPRPRGGRAPPLGA